MKTSNKILLTAMGIVLLLTAAVIVRLGVFVFYQQPDYVHFAGGDDEIINKVFSFQNFDSLKLEGFWKNVKIVRGDSYSVIIKASEGTHKHTNIKLSGSTLQISQGYFAVDRSSKAEMFVSMPSLKGLRVRGGSKIEFSGFRERQMAIESKGINEITGESCQVNSLVLTGSGVIAQDLSACVVVNARLGLTGFGTVELNMAGGKLEGQIDRDISVVYGGHVSKKAIGINADDEIMGAEEQTSE